MRSSLITSWKISAGSTANLVLGHLSEHNNHPEIVRLVALQALEQRSHAARLSIATQNQPSEVFQY